MGYGERKGIIKDIEKRGREEGSLIRPEGGNAELAWSSSRHHSRRNQCSGLHIQGSTLDSTGHKLYSIISTDTVRITKRVFNVLFIH